MAAPTFEWDPHKAATNIKDHSVSFEEAVSVFRDPLAKIHDDPEHSTDERRDILVGHSQRGALLVVSFVDRGGKHSSDQRQASNPA
jgi:uncharacterized protein